MKLAPSARTWQFLNWGAIITIVISAIFLQTHALINWDVSFLMEATERFLQGGTYLQNFYETNPPMIFYLYVPPVLIGMKYLGLSKAHALMIYVVTLSLLAIGLCSTILRRLFIKPNGLTFIILSVTAFILLVLPLFEFGQREHLLMILAMPYLFLAAAQIQRVPVKVSETILISVMAGFGFAIKPFFPISLIFIEIYCMLKKRSVLSCIRLETIIILSIFFCYFISIRWLFPDYLETIIPILFHLYYPGFGLPLIELCLNEKTIHCSIILLAFLVWRSKMNHHVLYDVFALAGIGYLALFLLEKTAWFYHLLPMLGMAILLCSVVMYTHIKKILTYPSTSSFLFLGILLYFAYYATALTHANIYYLLDGARQGKRSEIIAFLKQYPPKTTWDLISTKAVIFPIVDYANVLSVSRFPNYWWLPGIIKLKQNTTDQQTTILLNHYLNYFIGLVSDDIIKNKPRLIFVDADPYNTELHTKNIDYIHLLSQNKYFPHIWQHYHYVKTLEQYDIYEYDQ